MIITYLGHSAFEIQTGNHKILLDPFLVKSPDYDPSDVCDILVTHGHGDHLGSAVDISKEHGATITAVHELAGWCAKQGAAAVGMNVGGWITYAWGRACAVPAFHSSSTPDGTYAGCSVGYILEIEGTTIYYAGDTSLSHEMKMIGEVYEPDVAMLPIGGHYTMGMEHAAIAAKWAGAQAVIPMHFNTFSAIEVDTVAFESMIIEQDKTPLVMEIGETIELA